MNRIIPGTNYSVNSPLGEVVPVELLRTATLDLTDDQIKALPTTSIEILPAPGINKIIIPVFSILRIDTTAGAYSNVTVDDASLQLSWYPNLDAVYFAINDDTGITHVTDFIASLTLDNKLIIAPPPFGYVGGGWDSAQGTLGRQLSYMENIALSISAYNADGDFEDGNPANTGFVKVWYIILDLS